MSIENTYRKLDPEQFDRFLFTKVYQEGDQGTEILLAKQMLLAYGLYQGEMDEVFGEDLATAVYDFQSQAGLYPYGVLDLTTQLQLRNYMSVVEFEEDHQLVEALRRLGIQAEIE